VRAPFLGALLLSPCLALAQPVAVGAGYLLPRPIAVAPGQVITLFVRVPGKAVTATVTAQPPLPTALGGFAVMLRQTFPSDPVPVPIQSVADSQFCSQVTPSQCDVVSLVTVQIPYQLTPNIPRSRMPQNSARLDITYNDVSATSLYLNPVTDQIHVVNSCDLIANFPEGNCAPVVTHSDGALVDIEHPAQPGETLTASLAGLGQISPPLVTGAAGPNPAAAVDGAWLRFDARADAAPVRTDPATDSPATARLRPGSVGMYEVLFTVPALPDATPACGGDVHSNLTVSIGRTVSYDGVAICVAK
jgi:uncharacterized protein (TIGR03437 family)